MRLRTLSSAMTSDHRAMGGDRDLERFFYERVQREQRGVFRLEQWAAEGMSRKQLENRLARGLVKCLFYKVYALPGVPNDEYFRISAGVLKAGPIAAAYAGTAAAVMGLQRFGETLRIASTRRLDGIEDLHFHRVALRPEEIKIVDGVAVTDAPRTLIDCCGMTHPLYAGRLLDKAVIRGLTTFDELWVRVEQESRQGFSGLRNMRDLLLSRDPSVERAASLSEVDVINFLERNGFPRPLVNVMIDVGGPFPWRPDFYYKEAELVLERDHHFTHGDRFAHDRDRMKDFQMKTAGIQVIRITSEMMEREGELAAGLWKIYRERVAMLADRRPA